MSKCYWTIEGVGLKTNDIQRYLDTEKLVKLFHEQLPEDEELNEMISAEDYSAFELRDFLYGEPFQNLADVLCHCDDSNTLTYGDDGEGTDYLYYPPSMPWERRENEPQTEDCVIANIIKAVRRITNGLTDDEIRSMVDSDLHVYGEG